MVLKHQEMAVEFSETFVTHLKHTNRWDVSTFPSKRSELERGRAVEEINQMRGGAVMSVQ